MERIERLDSYAMRTALLFAWLFVVASCAFVIALNWHGMEFAPFPIAFICVLSLFEFVRRAYIAYYATDSEECAEEAADSEESTQPAEEGELPHSELLKRANFYSFVHVICTQGITGEGAWEKRGVPSATYKEWMPLLKKMQVVSNPGPGAAPKPLMDFESALKHIASFSDEADYWKPVRDSYYPNLTPHMMTIPANTL